MWGSGYENSAEFFTAMIANPLGPFHEEASKRAVFQRTGKGMREPDAVASIAIRTD